MEILSGEIDVLISESEGWKTIKSGGQFEVPAKSKFGLNVKSLTDYCCSYINKNHAGHKIRQHDSVLRQMG